MASRVPDGLAVSTGCVYDLGVLTEEAIDAFGARGVRDVEVFVQCVAELDPAYVEDLAARCRSHGITVGSLHPYVHGFENQLFARYSRQRTTATHLFEQYLDVCALLGATAYVSHGPTAQPVGRNGGLDEAYARRTGDLVAIAADHGVRYCLENVSYGVMRTPADATAHLERCEGLSYVLDVKSAWKAGATPVGFVEALGDHIAHTQVSFRRSPSGPFGSCGAADAVEPDLDAMFAALANRPSATRRHVVEVFWATSLDEVVASASAVAAARARADGPPREPTTDPQRSSPDA